MPFELTDVIVDSKTAGTGTMNKIGFNLKAQTNFMFIFTQEITFCVTEISSSSTSQNGEKNTIRGTFHSKNPTDHGRFELNKNTNTIYDMRQHNMETESNGCVIM